jgi:hypothetical protein
MASGVRTFVVAATAATLLVGVASAAGEPREFDDSSTYPFRLTCGERAFGVSALEQPGGVERRDTAIGRAVRRISKSFAPEFGGAPRGWRILGRTRKKVELAAGDPPMPWLLLGRDTRFSRGPGWDMLELDSGCYPFAVSDLGGPAIWHPDPADLPLAEDATTFTALVQEQSCASGDPPGDRVTDPVIRYGAEQIGIAFFVRPKRGFQTCPGAPPTEVEIRLDEPLGTRGLADLGVFPPVSLPTVPPLDLEAAYAVLDEVLTERFPSYRDPRRLFVDCAEELSATERDCVVLFGDRHYDFRGHMYVRRGDAAGVHFWSYEFTRTDRSCDAQGGEASECKETVTGEGTVAID